MEFKACQTCSHKLVRCEVFNKDLVRSVRFVMLDNFKLWLYMMEQKHGQTVANRNLCLWVNQEEFSKQEDLYTMSYQKEKVSMVVILVYDEKNRFTFPVKRFVHSNTVEMVTKILLGHVSKDIKSNDCVETQVYPGYVLSRFDKIDKFTCGLSDAESIMISEFDISA